MPPQGHPRPNELFRGSPLETRLPGWLRDAERAADGLSDDEAVAIEDEAWTTQIVDRFAIDPLVLREDEAYIEERGAGRTPHVVVPFDGDPALFTQDPRSTRARSSPGYTTGPFGKLEDGTLRMELTSSVGTSKADRVVEIRLAPVRQHVEATRHALERFRNDLADAARRGLPRRRERVQRHREFLSSATLPVRRRTDAPTNVLSARLNPFATVRVEKSSAGNDM